MNEESINIPVGTSPEEAQLLLDAEQRRREKAARTKIDLGKPVKDTLEAAIERVNKLPNLAIPPAGGSPVHDAVKTLRAAANLSPRHNRDIPDGTSPWHDKRASLAARLGTGFLVALVGTWGTGKTQLGTALIYAATARKLTGKYAVAMDFFIALKNSFDDTAKLNETAVIESFIKPKLLVLDECDERSESPWENRLLFHMINKRYNALLDTILISRRSKDEFLASLGESIQSRIQEVGGCIECDWPSYREAKP